MRDFEFKTARTVDEAVSLMAEKGSQARILAGGTDVIVQMRAGRRTPERLVDIKDVAEANALSHNPESGLNLGAATPCYRIYQDQTVSKTYPGLIDAAAMIGGIQIQGRASIGGNLCNRGSQRRRHTSIDSPGRHRGSCRAQRHQRVAGGRLLLGSRAERLARWRGVGLDSHPSTTEERGRPLPSVHTPQRDGHRGGGRGLVGRVGWR